MDGNMERALDLPRLLHQLTLDIALLRSDSGAGDAALRFEIAGLRVEARDRGDDLQREVARLHDDLCRLDACLRAAVTNEANRLAAELGSGLAALRDDVAQTRRQYRHQRSALLAWRIACGVLALTSVALLWPLPG